MYVCMYVCILYIHIHNLICNKVPLHQNVCELIQEKGPCNNFFNSEIIENNTLFNTLIYYNLL